SRRSARAAGRPQRRGRSTRTCCRPPPPPTGRPRMAPRGQRWRAREPPSRDRGIGVTGVGRPWEVRSRRARRRPPPGAAPGALIQDPGAAPRQVRVMAYGPTGCHEAEGLRAGDVEKLIERWPVTWIDVVGLADIERI